jgi:hypothetical protein
MGKIYVECVYREKDLECKILYASPYYLKTMDKKSDSFINYNKLKRERDYSDEEIVLLKPLLHKKN